MHAVVLRAIRTARRPSLRTTSLVVAGCRHPIPRRSFHRSAILHRAPEKSAEKSNGEKEDLETTAETAAEAEIEAEEPNGENENTNFPQTAASLLDTNIGTEAPSLTPKKPIKSSRTRGARTRQPEGLPPFLLPTWFLDNNVKHLKQPQQSGTLSVYAESTTFDNENESVTESTRQFDAVREYDLHGTAEAKYSIHVEVFREIFTSLKAALILRPPQTPGAQSIVRPPIVLQCPKDDGSSYLDSIVETVAKKLEVDLISVNPQDIAQLVGSYKDENLAWSRVEESLIGYMAQKAAGKLEEYAKDTPDPEEEGELEQISLKTFFNMSGNSKAQRAQQSSRQPKRDAIVARFSGLQSQPVNPYPPQVVDTWPPPAQSSNNDQWNDLKINTVLEALVDSTEITRALSLDNVNEGDNALNKLLAQNPDLVASSERIPKGLIVQIQDYNEIWSTVEGGALLQRLKSIVNKKWQEGKNIILVGTTTMEVGDPALSRPEIEELQSDITEGEKRTIYVPPDRRIEQEVVFESDEKSRIRRINIRHINDMIVKLTEGTQDLSGVSCDIETGLDNASAIALGLEDAVWKFSHVHRVATTIVGLKQPSDSIDGLAFERAVTILDASDNAKFQWGSAEIKKEEEEEAAEEIVKEDPDSAQTKSKKKLKAIRAKCSTHEAKFLSGVIDPADMRVTFADVQTPKETVDALKTLTSLSLIRPEAFSYGVLATDKIPGLLLYGPPGTGKTLLAKAVAKECGATMLEVSAADLNDMYVGEGEKNVKALFSLAKKLTPCVVFLDEADSILGARHSARKGGNHRELINQFLREWDGMNDMSAFIMVATNRPFDLDEAVLRRLPRRLLIDLPMEKERESILKIHLKDEVLDETVDLSKIAKDTPFYSGSDLKNVSVAAALACVREENKMAAEHTGEEPFVYPPKRILTKAHFDKALEEISASISEDMSTLTAIRKFDEKYGDRKGRRKKGPGLGFGGTTIVEHDSESARVRKLQV